jgi:hypothetical protein
MNILRIHLSRLLLAAFCGALFCAMSSGASTADEYPDNWISHFRAECLAPKPGDVSAQIRAAYCECYEDSVKKSVPWRDAQILDLALSAKGEDAFDANEKAIADKFTKIINYCKVKAGL